MKHSLFDWLTNVQTTGGDIMGEDPEAIKSYEPFMVSRGCAQSLDCVLFANELNRNQVTRPEFHYGFLLHSITKKKRYSKWTKKGGDPEDLGLIQQVYQVSKERALEYLEMLSPEEIEQIKAHVDPGGRKTAARNKK